MLPRTSHLEHLDLTCGVCALRWSCISAPCHSLHPKSINTLWVVCPASLNSSLVNLRSVGYNTLMLAGYAIPGSVGHVPLGSVARVDVMERVVQRALLFRLIPLVRKLSLLRLCVTKVQTLSLIHI